MAGKLHVWVVVESAQHLRHCSCPAFQFTPLMASAQLCTGTHPFAALVVRCLVWRGRRGGRCRCRRRCSSWWWWCWRSSWGSWPWAGRQAVAVWLHSTRLRLCFIAALLHSIPCGWVVRMRVCRASAVSKQLQCKAVSSVCSTTWRVSPLHVRRGQSSGT